jgi:hypothetical protein
MLFLIHNTIGWNSQIMSTRLILGWFWPIHRHFYSEMEASLVKKLTKQTAATLQPSPRSCFRVYMLSLFHTSMTLGWNPQIMSTGKILGWCRPFLSHFYNEREGYSEITDKTNISCTPNQSQIMPQTL